MLLNSPAQGPAIFVFDVARPFARRQYKKNATRLAESDPVTNRVTSSNAESFPKAVTNWTNEAEHS